MLLGVAQLKAIAALTLLSPFVPLLFQGEEWGARTPFLYFTDHQDAELGRLVAAGRSREFSSFRWAGTVPNPQELETFTRSKLDWSELSRPPHAEIYQWYRQLIRLRAQRRARTKASVKFDAAARWLRFVHGEVLCVFNLSDAAQRVPLPRGAWRLELRSDAAVEQPAVEQRADEVPGQATFIFRRRTA
jgi:maltooligosyltrehalose trehalohydrolase